MQQFLTITDYLKQGKKQCTPQAIRKSIKQKKLHLLTDVVSVKKIGRDWLLEIRS